MSTLREDFERHMSECGLSVGARDDEGYIASQIEKRWQSYQAATERAAKVAEAEAVEEIGDGDAVYNMAIRHCAAAIRSGGEAGS